MGPVCYGASHTEQVQQEGHKLGGSQAVIQEPSGCSLLHGIQSLQSGDWCFPYLPARV